MEALIDTNVLVYRFDPRDPFKQEVANEILRSGLKHEQLALPHQAIIEFVAAVMRPKSDLAGLPLLEQPDALREAESLMTQFPVLYPNQDVLRTALRGCATYGLSWFDAHLWAYAEVAGIPEIISEDFEHGLHYGRVRVVNPFLSDSIQELPPLYA